MKIAVKLFGPQSQLAGASEISVTLEVDAPTISDLRQALVRAEPKLAAGLPRSRLAVNFEFAAEDQPLRAGDEVALIGMVCGG